MSPPVPAEPPSAPPLYFLSVAADGQLFPNRRGVAMVFAGIGFEIMGKYRRHTEKNVENVKDRGLYKV